MATSYMHMCVCGMTLCIVCMHKHMSIPAYIPMHMCVCVCECVCVCIYVYVCMYQCNAGQEELKIFFFALELLICDFRVFWMRFWDEIKLEKVARCGGGLGNWFGIVLWKKCDKIYSKAIG